MNKVYEKIYLLILSTLFILLVSRCGTTTGNYLTIQGTLPNTLTTAISMITDPYGLTDGLQTEQNQVQINVKNRIGNAIGTITLTDARLALKEIKIKMSDDDITTPEQQEENDKIKLEGPYVVNLVANSITPSLPSIDLAAGTYKEIELKLHKIDGNETSNNGGALVEGSDNLFDNSIYIEGSYTPEGSNTNVDFTFSYDLTEEFSLSGSNASEGFTIAADQVNQIIVAFRFAKWFQFNRDGTNEDDIDFIPDLEGGKIHFHKDGSSTNKKIRKVIRNNIKASADYGKDIDGNGKLDISEDDDPDSEDEDDDNDD